MRFKQRVNLVLLVLSFFCFSGFNFFNKDKQEWKRFMAESQKLVEQGNYSKAEENIESAIVLAEEVFDSYDPSLGATYNYLAKIYIAQGRYNEAISYCQKAHKIVQTRFGDHPNIISVLVNWVRLFIGKGDFKQAEIHAKRILEIMSKAYKENDPELSFGLNTLGAVYRNQGRYDEAEKMLDDGGQRELKRWVDEQDFNVYTRFIEPTGCWKFWFDSEEDRVLFKLRWLEWIK